MVKNHHLAKSIHDAGWSQLIEFTKSKAECAEKVVEQVDPRNTSKTCSQCGYIQVMPLSQRTYNCPKCNLSLDRDHNAAINIKSRAVGITVQACVGDLENSREPVKHEACLLIGG